MTVITLIIIRRVFSEKCAVWAGESGAHLRASTTETTAWYTIPLHSWQRRRKYD